MPRVRARRLRHIQEARERAARESAQRHLATQYEVSRILTEAPACEEAIPKLLRAICEGLGFVTGTLWGVDKATNSLRCLDVWHPDSVTLKEFVAKTREAIVAPGVAIPGRCWSTGKPVWFPDTTKETNFPRAPSAARAGLRAAMAFPIRIRGEIIGIADFFSVEVRPPDTELLEMLSATGNQIGQFMERQVQQQQIARLNRVYAVLSGINSAIIRVRDRQELFAEACRIAVEQGGFGMAWVSEYDPVTLDVTPIAWAGDGAREHADSKSTARADVPLGQGVVGRAIRTRKPAICNDLLAEPDVGSSKRREAIRRGYRSLIGLPLLVEGAVVGTVTLYAREPGFFTEEETKLLAELAADISFALELIEKKDRLRYLAYYDVLTGLPNRDLFADRLGHLLQVAMREHRKVAVLVVDLERFSLVNETFGRHVGDALLKEVAQRLSAAIRSVDVTGAISAEDVARIGAVRFAAALGAIDDETDVAHVVEARLLKFLSEPFVIDGNELTIAARVGVAIYPQDGKDADTLITNGEAAVRDARGSDAKFLFYAPAMNARVTEILLLENKLRKALDREEFILHYQPIVDLKTDVLVGLEALLRWNNPQVGLVAPDKFIAALEESGMILQAGEWVLKTATAKYRQWANKGLHPPRVAVNVSPIQLRHKEFVRTVEQAVVGSGAELDLEITETVIMREIEDNIAKLTAIRAMGIGVEIDDFGTGYSSLAYLARLPITALKIDRAFIATLPNSADNMAIVSTIISLAHALKLKVVAEGVETEEQAKLLRLLQCDEMQGYLFSKPLSSEEIPPLLARSRAK